jgi:hypothetical protein
VYGKKREREKEKKKVNRKAIVINIVLIISSIFTIKIMDLLACCKRIIVTYKSIFFFDMV